MGELSSILRPLIPVARKVLPWALRHPFVLRPRSWWLALLGWFMLCGLLLVAGAAGPLVFIPFGLMLMIIVAGLMGWHRLTAVSSRPVVLITEFDAATPTGLEAAHHHREALVERLLRGALGKQVEVRSVPVAVNLEQATRLLDAVPAMAVVFGSVKAIAASGTWKAELLVRWPGEDAAPVHVTGGDRTTLVLEHFDRRADVPDHHEAVEEPQAPLERLIAESFEFDHADRVEGTLLALTATYNDDEAAAELLLAAERFRSKLSPRTRAAMEIQRAGTENFESPAALLDALDEAARRDAGHVDLWNFLSVVSFVGLLAGEVSIARHASIAERAVAADAEDPTARYNLGEVYMALGRADEALQQFEFVAAHPEYRDRYYVHLARGIIAYNLDRSEEARDAYRRAVELRPTAQGFLYLADAHRRLGEESEARKNYRRALQAQPTLTDAHRGYWYAEKPTDELPGRSSWWFDPAFHMLSQLRPRQPRHLALYWLLRVHYRLHPEDSRIHFMLGASALLRERFVEAEERLQFAYDLMRGVDLEALASLALVRGLQGRLDEARNDLTELRDAPNAETGEAPGHGEHLQRVGYLLSPMADRPSLTLLPHADELATAMTETFPGIFGEIGTPAGSSDV